MASNLKWLTDPGIFAVNRIPAHSDHSFYANKSETENEHSSLVQPLNGVWKFSYAKTHSARKADFYTENFDLSDFDEITVPGHIELQGFGKPQYVNTMYPWEGSEQLTPPQIPLHDAPVGSYVRFFDLADGLRGKRIFISFQGVETAFYLWLNGEFIGYSEDSFTPAEFELTPYIREKNNRLCVEVHKRCSGSWLEDQDFWRFSGIFRDVYLYAIPSAHLWDMKLIADFDGSSGIFSAKLSIEGECPAKISLTDENKKTVFCDIYDGEKPVVLSDVKPWNAERPYLYTVTVTLFDNDGNVAEISKTKVGFRRFELKNGIMLLNGKRIIFKGINRHEFSCRNGRTLTAEEMLFDIRFMKRNNINAVRTCHYPNDPLWYRLCDEYGIYLIDEANLETHGTWAFDTEKNIPASLPEWKDAVLDRARSMYERDKNHPCVLIWSCGNESYCGDDIAAMAEYFHTVDKTRLVHYEGVFHNRKYDDITDMESRMYAKPDEIREYLQSGAKKPYISCEYMHAMGNSLGGMHLYTGLEDKYEAYQGGFIWDYIDQTLLIDGEMRYGEDFDDRPTDYNFCANGIVFADRTESPKVQEVKALYSNIKMMIESGILTIENRNLFADTSDLIFTASLYADGYSVSSYEFTRNIAAGETESIPLSLSTDGANGEIVYTVSAALAVPTKWAETGYETAFAQKVISRDCGDIHSTAPEFPRIVYGDVVTGIHGKDFSMLFDRKAGRLVSLRYGSTEFIENPPQVSFHRALTDNDIGAGEISPQWLIAGKFAEYSGCEQRETNKYIELAFKYKAASTPSFEFIITYTAYFDGRLGVKANYPGVEGMSVLPVFAIDFQIKKDFSEFSYYGMGPNENYTDRCCGARLGRFFSSAQKNLTLYVRPQECGNRTGVRELTVHNRAEGLVFKAVHTPFEMSVLPFSAYELENASHIEELPPAGRTWIRIAANQTGVGGDDSWGAPVHKEYKINAENPITLEFEITGSKLCGYKKEK